MNLKQFCSRSHLPPTLVRAVVRQSGGWAEWPQTARDVCTGGAGGGFHGFIYYRDTVAFTKRHQGAILGAVKSMADDMGEPAFAMIASFCCLRSSKLTGERVAELIYSPRADKDERDQVFNALAWFALEEVARSYCDLIEQGELS